MRFCSEDEERIQKSGVAKQLACTQIPGNFHVTTCYRESSAAITTPPWYYETFVWKNKRNGDREIAFQAESHVAGCEWALHRIEWLIEEEYAKDNSQKEGKE